MAKSARGLMQTSTNVCAQKSVTTSWLSLQALPTYKQEVNDVTCNSENVCHDSLLLRIITTITDAITTILCVFMSIAVSTDTTTVILQIIMDIVAIANTITVIRYVMIDIVVITDTIIQILLVDDDKRRAKMLKPLLTPSSAL